MNDVMYHRSETDSSIQLTEAAKRHVLQYLQKQGGRKGIRLSIKKTGCSGMSYVIDYVDSAESDIVVSIPEFLVCIDKSSYPYLKGLAIDYVKQGLNGKFVFTNPNETGQCGCGESFTID